MMGSNIELWQYKLYENGIISIDEVFRKSGAQYPSPDTEGKNPIMIEAGKKAAQTRKTATYTFEKHANRLNPDLVILHNEIREYIVNLASSIEETPKQNYISYKTSQNFVCLESQKRKMMLFLKINPDELEIVPKQARDVRNIGHFGTGDLEFTIKNAEDFEAAKPLIELSLKNIGG
jgi:predicted transport protein